jgi:hypothetical protein
MVVQAFLRVSFIMQLAHLLAVGLLLQYTIQKKLGKIF